MRNRLLGKGFGVGLVGVVCLVLFQSLALAQFPPFWSKPEKAGFSQERLNRITTVLREDTEKGKLVGAVALIVRKGKTVYLETFGYQDKLAGKRMEKEAIFRIYSMTKPITSTALMMLWEEGRIDLFNPLEMYLPEFKDPKVAVVEKGADGKPAIVRTEPAKRKITVLDVMRHTSGLSYGFTFTGHPLDLLYAEKGLGRSDQTLAEFSEKLGPLPLMYHPGTVWHYGLPPGIDYIQATTGVLFSYYGASVFLLAMAVLGWLYARLDRWFLRSLSPATQLAAMGLTFATLFMEFGVLIYFLTFRSLLVLYILLAAFTLVWRSAAGTMKRLAGEAAGMRPRRSPASAPPQLQA